MLLGFLRHVLLSMFGVAIVWNLMLRVGSPRSTISNCVRAIQASRASLGPDPRVVFSILLSLPCFFVHPYDTSCSLMVI